MSRLALAAEADVVVMHGQADGEELGRLRSRCEELEDANAQLKRINEALMNRVERDMDMQGSSFSLFQAAIALEEKVKQRTAALSRALHALEQGNHELQASNEAAQAASRAKSAFLAAMSHELRTPMHGVVGMAEILLATELAHEQRKSVETIRQSALALLKILNDILDFSKIEAGHLATEAAPFELRVRTEQALDLLRPQISGKGLDLLVDWPAEIPSDVIGDPTRYVQILTNLIGNALKFTSRGHICVRARVVNEHQTSVVLRFEVEDTGVGIRPEVMPRLFEPFVQADTSTTRQFGGTGLGLAIVRRLCQLMGGDCGVVSEYGRGSRFWFTLTMRRGTKSVAVASSATAVAAGAPPTRAARTDVNVLVVEDNPVNQLVACGLLEALGCTATIVDNGLAAVDALTNPHGYDVVLMDCQMPEMDGLAATRHVRAHEGGAGPRIPIVALTANAMAGDREACLEAGMDDFLSKPFQLSDLAAMIDRWARPPADHPV